MQLMHYILISSVEINHWYIQTMYVKSSVTAQNMYPNEPLVTFCVQFVQYIYVPGAQIAIGNIRAIYIRYLVQVPRICMSFTGNILGAILRDCPEYLVHKRLVATRLFLYETGLSHGML